MDCAKNVRKGIAFVITSAFIFGSTPIMTRVTYDDGANNVAAAAILSTFEPITRVLCGTLFLGENLSLLKVTGCACIIASVILVAIGYTKILAQNASKRWAFIVNRS